MTATHRFIALVLSPAVCNACGRECPERHEIVEHISTGERLILGVGCAFKVAGIKPTDCPELLEDTGDTTVPAWMLEL